MSLNNGYQRSRYELKYLVDEPCARQVRDFVRSYLRRDRHAIPEMRYSYPIYSAYLDDPGLSLYHATTQAQKNRFKLRIRYYNHEPASPLFFEIKRRQNEVILKRRAVVRRSAMAELLSGRAPRWEDLHDPKDADSYDALREFSHLNSTIHAEPRIVIYFEREAWISPTDSSVRVTFDREAAMAPFCPNLRPKQWTDAQVPMVILELKF